MRIVGKIIAVSNQKGGCGKTTTVINLAVSLANMGKRVLCVDFDAQGNMTMGFGFPHPDEIENTIGSLLLKEITSAKPEEAWVPPGKYILESNRVDLIPSNVYLAELEGVLFNTMSRENVLKNFLAPHRGLYDFIFIDCLPSLGLLTINAMVAADEVLIPVEGQFFSVKGLELLLQTIGKVKRRLNPSLSIAGLVFTKIDNRSRFQKDAVETVESSYKDDIYIFQDFVPSSVKVSDKQSQGKPIIGEKNNAVAAAYEGIARTIVERA